MKLANLSGSKAGGRSLATWGAAVMLTALVVALSGCAKSGGDKADADDKAADKTADKDKAAPEAKPGLAMDAETQDRLGLKMATPEAAQWQPSLHATGRAANPLTFLSAVTDYETARSTAAASQAELERTQRLAAQDNASPRTLAAAQSTAAHDALALAAARAKFAADWGPQLAAQTNLADFAESLQTGSVSLARIFLPAGTFPDPLPTTATVSIFSQETNSCPAVLMDNLNVDPATQVQTLLFTAKQKLPPDVSLVAELKTPGEPVSGVVVPASAIIRHEGRGWAYVQTETNRFLRTEIPLDRFTDGGWFVAEDLSATNIIVITGAEAVLSAELGSGFNTGERD